MERFTPLVLWWRLGAEQWAFAYLRPFLMLLVFVRETGHDHVHGYPR